jgi:L-rhamnose-H+ transport protein
MVGSPVFGILFHWAGGLSSASFFVPYKGIRRWSFEVYWLVGGVFSWLIAPWMFAGLRTADLMEVLRATPPRTLLLCYFFGALWGLGGLTFGLTMRYLGVSLGMAIALGLTAAFGTLMPPLVSGELLGVLVRTTHGIVILSGVAVCLVGIYIVAVAGRRKESEVSLERQQGSVPEFNFRKGILVAVFSGVMSSSFAYGLAAGEPIRQITLAHGTDHLWQGLPVLVVVLLGGFTTNLIWCVLLIARNGKGSEFIGGRRGKGLIRDHSIPIVRNYVLCAVAGLVWYFQFFFYTMGESQMGRFGFSSWTLHTASIVIFSLLWGVGLREWVGSSDRTRRLLWLGISILISSTIIIGIGNYIGITSTGI